MPEVTLVDVCQLPPRERHPRIFSAWESLPVGEVLKLVNDHDPKPLYYEFNAERTGEFEWTYVEKGPERWAVEIKRIAPAQPQAKIPVSKCAVERPILETPDWARRAPTRTVDVREDLRQGREPFGKIMTAAQQTGSGQTLLIKAIFEPIPLYSVLKGQGFEHWTEKLADDDWAIHFLRP